LRWIGICTFSCAAWVAPPPHTKTKAKNNPLTFCIDRPPVSVPLSTRHLLVSGSRQWVQLSRAEIAVNRKSDSAIGRMHQSHGWRAVGSCSVIKAFVLSESRRPMVRYRNFLTNLTVTNRSSGHPAQFLSARVNNTFSTLDPYRRNIVRARRCYLCGISRSHVAYRTWVVGTTVVDSTSIAHDDFGIRIDFANARRDSRSKASSS
jgi:hypothetical protein